MLCCSGKPILLRGSGRAQPGKGRQRKNSMKTRQRPKQASKGALGRFGSGDAREIGKNIFSAN